MIYRLRTKDTMLGEEMATLTFLLADNSVLQLTLTQKEMATLDKLATQVERDPDEHKVPQLQRAGDQG